MPATLTTAMDFAQFAQVCKELQIKATQQRFEIYSELSTSTEHPDAETVYEKIKQRLPSISFDTVYRTMRSFEEKGLIKKLSAVNNKMRFDANLSNHYHFICKKCGIIKDFFSEDFDKITPPAELGNFGKIDNVRIEIIGLCNNCKQKKS